jgi:nucleoside-triphosphatase THEP1
MTIIISGEIGVGKTSVCRKLAEIIQNKGHSCGGILTYKASDKGVIKGIIIEDIKSGQTETLASTSHDYSGPRTARYCFNPRGIEFGIKAIGEGASASTLIVDEIGYLELDGKGFVRALELANIINHCVLVIRSELLPRFLVHFSTKPLIFETTLANRNRLPEEIASALCG